MRLLKNTIGQTWHFLQFCKIHFPKVLIYFFRNVKLKPIPINSLHSTHFFKENSLNIRVLNIKIQIYEYINATSGQNGKNY